MWARLAGALERRGASLDSSQAQDPDREWRVAEPVFAHRLPWRLPSRFRPSFAISDLSSLTSALFLQRDGCCITQNEFSQKIVAKGSTLSGAISLPADPSEPDGQTDRMEIPEKGSHVP